jgi:excinuclease ABC subunit A
VLDRLVEQGNTVIVIEHNLDVIKTADWIIDLGPEGGDAGGYLLVEGTPEAAAKSAQSHTGAFLRDILPRNAAARAPSRVSRRGPRREAMTSQRAQRTDRG